ncbi:hypothetical protein G7K_3791-t1 [Saitoella complicata NRRL Y-17804]|uniref:Uncharacterized protein n=1 Tax=Saitoella complicata (strain BCRC 22490 / CBS 7301 / JCM 7358 / NBRC 10748 / NRRL Y-17804) TaxID=698492 RepID=A0A0E9NIE6_SAICN|nr:hypothetical protein G7K_3791-t1 [Saitoella complicata NRRL Y-17804]
MSQDELKSPPNMTTSERAILTELQKILLTCQQINANLLKSVGLTTEAENFDEKDGAFIGAAREAARSMTKIWAENFEDVAWSGIRRHLERHCHDINRRPVRRPDSVAPTIARKGEPLRSNIYDSIP